MRKFLLVLMAAFSIACSYVPYSAVSKINIGLQGKPVLGSGSGFAIDEHLVVTAAHVCTPMLVGQPLFRDDGAKLTLVRMNMEKDLCLLYAKEVAKSWFDIAEDELQFNDKVTVLGMPLGIPNVIPTEGRMAGYYNINGTTLYSLSCPAFGGNSGGPVLNEAGEVVGVLVLGVPAYSQLSFGVRLPDLREFLGLD